MLREGGQGWMVWLRGVNGSEAALAIGADEAATEPAAGNANPPDADPLATDPPDTNSPDTNSPDTASPSALLTSTEPMPVAPVSAALTWQGETVGSVVLGAAGAGGTLAAPLGGAVVFGLMQSGGRRSPLGLRWEERDGAIRPAGDLDPLDLRCLRADELLPGSELRDAWFSSETELNLRFERGTPAPGAKPAARTGPVQRQVSGSVREGAGGG